MFKVFLNGVKKKNTLILPYIIERRNSNYSHNLGPWLAGLIEGDGHIAVHDKNSKSKKYRPKIIIVFSLADKPLAEKLSAVLKVGKVISKPSVGHVLLQILAKEEVLKIINLINGYMRTPKIEALHRAIN
jgi:LAGLIDADG endonuclease